MTSPKSTSRRGFLKMAMAAAATPILAGVARGASETTGTAEATAPAVRDGSAHRILTANILLASTAHEGTPAAWSNRRDLVAKVFREIDADVICMQEVLRSQVEDLKRLMDDYAFFGFEGPYMDAHPTGYHLVTKNVLMYRKDRYEMTSAGGYWLSETPLIAASVSWDAMRARHVNWLRLRDEKSGKEFRVIDTHFDHKGQVARENMARMINEEAQQYQDDFPQVLCGDLNARMDNPVLQILREGGWTETWVAVHGSQDPGGTFHKLQGADYPNKTDMIDYVLCRGPVEPKAAKVWRNHEGDKYPSDHYFVSADVLIG